MLARSDCGPTSASQITVPATVDLDGYEGHEFDMKLKMMEYEIMGCASPHRGVVTVSFGDFYLSL